jgi:hypothetical protein
MGNSSIVATFCSELNTLFLLNMLARPATNDMIEPPV